MPAIDDPDELRRRVAAAPVARLATVRPDGSPRLVPVTFALLPELGDLLCFAVDEVKPKRDARLARLDDIARDPRVTLLVDHYDDDWAAPVVGPRRRDRGPAPADGALRERALDAARRRVPALPRRAPGGTGRRHHALGAGADGRRAERRGGVARHGRPLPISGVPSAARLPP